MCSPQSGELLREATTGWHNSERGISLYNFTLQSSYTSLQFQGWSPLPEQHDLDALSWHLTSCTLHISGFHFTVVFTWFLLKALQLFLKSSPFIFKQKHEHVFLLYCLILHIHTNSCKGLFFKIIKDSTPQTTQMCRLSQRLALSISDALNTHFT